MIWQRSILACWLQQPVLITRRCMLRLWRMNHAIYSFFFFEVMLAIFFSKCWWCARLLFFIFNLRTHKFRCCTSQYSSAVPRIVMCSLPSYDDNSLSNIYTIKDETLRYNFYLNLVFLTPYRWIQMRCWKLNEESRPKKWLKPNISPKHCCFRRTCTYLCTGARTGLFVAIYGSLRSNRR